MKSNKLPLTTKIYWFKLPKKTKYIYILKKRISRFRFFFPTFILNICIFFFCLIKDVAVKLAKDNPDLAWQMAVAAAQDGDGAAPAANTNKNLDDDINWAEFA